MKNIYAFLISVVLVMGVTSQSSATIIYVRAAATGANNGTTWTDAFNDLQAGFGATLPGDTIWVAAGVYKPTTTTSRTISFALPDGVKILGGFNGTETNVSQRNYTTNVTNLSGDIGATGNATDNSYHVVTTAGVSNATILDGFRILSGNANSASSPNDRGGAFYNSSGNPVIRNCTLQSNAASIGGAVYQQTLGTFTFINCAIINNTSTGFTTTASGAISISGGSLVLQGCTITQNNGYNGGGLNMSGGNVIVDRCIISGNTANNSGGAIYGSGGFQFQMTNSLLVGNLASNGGISAIHCASVPTYNHKIINCTIADNRASAGSSATSVFSNFSEVDNTLYSGNSESTAISATALTSNNNKFVGINLTDAYFIAPGDNSLAPFSASSYNYHVAAFSGCIDYGSATYVIPAYNMDLDNTNRVQGPVPDCGCYENSGCTFNLVITSPDSNAICTGNTTVLSAGSGSAFLWGNNTTSSSITTGTAGTYTLEADSGGCYGSASYSLSLINASVTINGPSGFCPGDSISLVASGTNLNTYNWNTGDTTSTISVSTAGTYSVAIITTEGCTATSTLNITAYTAPNPIATFNSPVISTTTTFATYQWLLNGTPIGGATSQQYTVLQNGDYSVVVTNANGCSDTSALYNIINLGMNERTMNVISAFPNPCTDLITLSGSLADVSVMVYDLDGRTVNVAVKNRSTSQIVLDMSELQPGMYFICVSGNEGVLYVPAVKQ